MIEKEIAETFVQGNHDTILGGVAGLIAYLFDWYKATESKEMFHFSLLALITNVAMGAFVSYIVGTTLTETNEYRIILVGLSGFSAFSILTVARSKTAEGLLDRIFKKGV